MGDPFDTPGQQLLHRMLRQRQTRYGGATFWLPLLPLLAALSLICVDLVAADAMQPSIAASISEEEPASLVGASAGTLGTPAAAPNFLDIHGTDSQLFAELLGDGSEADVKLDADLARLTRALGIAIEAGLVVRRRVHCVHAVAARHTDKPPRQVLTMADDSALLYLNSTDPAILNIEINGLATRLPVAAGTLMRIPAGAPHFVECGAERAVWVSLGPFSVSDHRDLSGTRLVAVGATSCTSTSQCPIGQYCYGTSSSGVCDTCLYVLGDSCDEVSKDCCSATFLQHCPLGGEACPHCAPTPSLIPHAAKCPTTSKQATCAVKCKTGVEISHATTCTCKPGAAWPAWDCPSPVGTCPEKALGATTWKLGQAGKSCSQVCTGEKMACKPGTPSPGLLGLEAIALTTAPLKCSFGYNKDDYESTVPYSDGLSCWYNGAADATVGCLAKPTGGSTRRFCPCVSDCETPTVVHGTTAKCPLIMKDGTSCTPECTSGYHLTGGDITCVAGRLTALAKCEPDPCNSGNPPLHGSRGKCPSTLQSGKSCLPDCDSGCTLKGVRSCLAGHLTEASCLPNPCSDADAAPKHGSAGSCPPILDSGDSCEIDCNVGFKRAGKRTCSLGNLTHAGCEQCDSHDCEQGVCTHSGSSCNCTDGWAGDKCSLADNLCAALAPCTRTDINAICSKAYNHDGYMCNCSTGYASSGEPGVNCDRLVFSTACGKTCWQIVCIISTILAVLPVPYMVRRFQRSFDQLREPQPDLQLPEERRQLGIVGLLLFILGIVDLLLDVSLCITLSDCDQTILLVCAIIILLVTTGMTWRLGYYALQEIVKKDRRHDTPARAWLLDNPIRGPLVVLASSSRLNSMAILRLNICGTMWIEFDDAEDHRYFHFLRSAGMYHYWVEDIPHVLLSLAIIYSPDDEGFQACMEGGHSKMISVAGRQVTLPVGDKDIAYASLIFSLGSVIFGVLNKAMQLLTVELAAAGDDEVGIQQAPVPLSLTLSMAFRRVQAEGPGAMTRLLAESSDTSGTGSSTCEEDSASDTRRPSSPGRQRSLTDNPSSSSLTSPGAE